MRLSGSTRRCEQTGEVFIERLERLLSRLGPTTSRCDALVCHLEDKQLIIVRNERNTSSAKNKTAQSSTTNERYFSSLASRMRLPEKSSPTKHSPEGSSQVLWLERVDTFYAGTLSATKGYWKKLTVRSAFILFTSSCVPLLHSIYRRKARWRKTYQWKAHSKTVGCAEKLTGLLKDADKCSPTNRNHNSAISEMLELA